MLQKLFPSSMVDSMIVVFGSYRMREGLEKHIKLMASTSISNMKLVQDLKNLQ
jgi:hypothetical protein